MKILDILAAVHVAGISDVSIIVLSKVLTTQLGVGKQYVEGQQHMRHSCTTRWAASTYPPVVLISDRFCHHSVLPKHELNEHHGC